MTLPSLINKTRNKELHTAYLKTYSELNQIAERFAVDKGFTVPEYAQFSGLGLAVTEISKYYADSANVNKNGMGTADDDGKFIPFYDINYLSGKKYSGGANSQGRDSSFMCDNTAFKSNKRGAIYIFNDPPANGLNGPVVCVDINGKKGPNRYGVDYFMFIFTVDGGVIPMGLEHKNNAPSCYSGSGSCGNFANTGEEFCDPKSSNIATNTSCAYYALINQHPTEDGLDYWQDFLGEVYRR